MFLKDQIRERALKKIDQESVSSDASSDSENESAIDKKPKKESELFEKIGVPLNDQEQLLKKEFQKEAFADDASGDDDFLVKKKSPVQSDSEDEPIKQEEAPAPKAKEMNLVTDKELLARFYGNDNELDDGEKFLRTYILQEGWKDKGQKIKLPKTDREKPLVKKADAGVDEEDEKREGEMDNFEVKYNFRFEDPNAATITTYAREANEEETLRKKSDTRKQARERAKERKEDLKRSQREEIAKLKELKREEIIEKLRKTDRLSKGNLFEDRAIIERV